MSLDIEEEEKNNDSASQSHHVNLSFAGNRM